MDNIESILTSVKDQLGIEETYTHFDKDLIIHINSVLMVLNQLGVGPEIPYTIRDANDKWIDFLEDNKQVESVKTYMYMKVRMIFDPPQNSFTINAAERIINEFEWRLNVQAEGGM